MKRFYLILSLLLFLILLPLIGWQVKPAMSLSATVINKTVADETFREHQGVHWLFNYLKIPNLNGQAFELNSDYYGPVLNEKAESYINRELPTDYSTYDLVYLADTYGVYENDLPWVGEENQAGEGKRSTKILGGLDSQEWQLMRSRFDDEKPSLLITEFNSFASPTDIRVRDSLTHFLGLEWEGWLGRYFDELDLTLNTELPQWLIEEHGDSWEYTGPGILLVNDFNGEIVVLEGEEHLKTNGVNLQFTPAGQTYFGLESSTNYDYWFDLVTPKGNAEVLATYNWNLTLSGQELLSRHNIPLESAAVIRKEVENHTSFYFAGDYNDTTDLPLFYKIKGLCKLNQWLATMQNGNFYWSAFVPMMEKILTDFEAETSVQKAQVHTFYGEMRGQLEETDSQDPSYSFRVTDQYFEVLNEAGEWEELIIKGVNMGMAKPGYFPGEAAISEAEYARWFEMIGDMNANTIRVYTIHPPEFYRALREYNQTHEDPLYLFHGVWMNEENSIASQNNFEAEILGDFQEEIRKIVDLTHGNCVLEARPGHAYGIYDADISDYIIGWMIGTEWDPYVVVGTNSKNQGIGDYRGNYFETQAASPFEHFLAQQMDLMMTYEIAQYNTQRPISFSNWVTTDLLDHPTESIEDEDLVSINPNLIHSLGLAQKTGQYASYHVYPYYPDFLNFTQRYNRFIDHRGNPNNYAAYLKDLHQAHDMPVLIAEFGIPASRGRTHENTFGRHQGGIAESEQGRIVSEMFEEIIEEGMLGGLVFAWQDEWFKRTWNTMEYDNPDRRPFWSNAQTNEQQFGILSFDTHKIRVNGDVSDWGEVPQLLTEQGEIIQGLYIDHDERYLYIRLDYNPESKGYLLLTLDTVPDQGNQTISAFNHHSLNQAAEFLINFSPEESRILVDEYYDFFTIQYGLELEMLGPDISFPEKNSGNFMPIQFALNKEYFIVEENRTLPFTAHETGKLIEGKGDPAAEDYDSLADYFINREKGMIELRLPWMLISSRDPSQREFHGDLIEEGLEASVKVEAIAIEALFVEEGKVLTQTAPVKYSWEKWDLPPNEERLKESYWILQELFENY